MKPGFTYSPSVPLPLGNGGENCLSSPFLPSPRYVPPFRSRMQWSYFGPYPFPVHQGHISRGNRLRMRLLNAQSSTDWQKRDLREPGV